MITREEHLDWCKQRAREYCESGDAINALMLMFSDLGEHPETANHVGIKLGLMLIAVGNANNKAAVVRHINCYN